MKLKKIVLAVLYIPLSTNTGFPLTYNYPRLKELRSKGYDIRIFQSLKPPIKSKKHIKKRVYFNRLFFHIQLESLIIYLIFPLIGNLVIRRTFIDARLIHSLSMHPTITVGDHIVVDKISHFFRSCRINDIVLFNLSCKISNNIVFIKRIVGMEGDEIYISKNNLFRNGVIQRENFVNGPTNYNWGPFKIPSNHVLLLGDNRNLSWDGHSWGSLPLNKIFGRAIGIYWPFIKIPFNNKY